MNLYVDRTKKERKKTIHLVEFGLVCLIEFGLVIPQTNKQIKQVFWKNDSARACWTKQNNIIVLVHKCYVTILSTNIRTCILSTLSLVERNQCLITNNTASGQLYVLHSEQGWLMVNCKWVSTRWFPTQW